MNIIIPIVDNEKSKDFIAKGFHNTSYACIFNRRNNTFKSLAIKDISTLTDNLSLALKHHEIYTVITNQMPQLTFNLFRESGIAIYKAKGKSVTENIQLFLKDELDSFVVEKRFLTSSCSSSCNIGSCNTSCN